MVVVIAQHRFNQLHLTIYTQHYSVCTTTEMGDTERVLWFLKQDSPRSLSERFFYEARKKDKKKRENLNGTLQGEYINSLGKTRARMTQKKPPLRERTQDNVYNLSLPPYLHTHIGSPWNFHFD